MFKRLEKVEQKYEQLNSQLQDPNVASNQKRYTELMKEYSTLEAVITPYRQYKKIQNDIAEAKDILETLADEDMRALAKEDLNSLEPELAKLEGELKILLLPKDPNDEKNIILEIRAGAGGDEASLFAEELFRAYSYYAQENKWKVELLSISEGNAGGFKEVVAGISGDRVFSKLKFERGVHRVQRVPKTESQGRVHTSTVTVATLPEAEEVDVQVNNADLRIDVYRSSGAGGQHVNTTDSAVRITHLPTGVVVSCQDEKSQIKNKAKAMKVLYSKLLALEEEEKARASAEDRQAQVGTGDRSERIRTYNFPQTRITDHRIGLTLHSLTEVMGGSFSQIIDPLQAHYQAEALNAQKDQ